MIVQKHNHFLRYITQIEHAKLAASLLPHIHTYARLNSSIQNQLKHACLHHDDGWLEFDTTPTFSNNTIIPLDFTQIPATQHIQIWKKSRQRIQNQHSLAKRLVCRHNIYLANIRLSNTVEVSCKNKLAAFITAEKLIEKTLKNSTLSTISESEILTVEHLLQLADWLSLAACLNKPLSSDKFKYCLKTTQYPEIKLTPRLSEFKIAFTIHTTEVNLKTTTKKQTKLTLTFN